MTIIPDETIDRSEEHCPVCGGPMITGRCEQCPAATIDSSTGTSAGTGSAEGKKNQKRPHQASADQLGDYELIRELTRGGMGVVYHARHKQLGRDVALKLILAGQFASEQEVRRFYMEAESAASLDHPSIVPIYDIGEEGGHHYFTMKLIEGGSLAASLETFAATPKDLSLLVAKVADAMDYAHRRGIMHRDIKPANILIDTDSQPVVTDLGLAKRVHSESDLTGTGNIVGTPAYMAPEQATSSKEVTTAADIYSIGAILYQGLCGRPPHQEETVMQTLLAAARGGVGPPSDHHRGIDRVLEAICMKCLADTPEDRYASAGQLAADLRAWVDGEPVSVRPRSMTHVVSDLLVNQARSVLGVMMLGVLGGILIGLPMYVSLQASWLAPGGRMDLAQVNANFSSDPLPVTWVVLPPDNVRDALMLTGLLFMPCLGIVIHRLARPKDSRQAIALGLVAGLIMSIVQFGFYGIAASWHSYGIQNADSVEWIAMAGFGTDAQRADALNTIAERYPDLAILDPSQRGEAISDRISAEIMLGTPPVFLGVFTVCVVFSILFCVLGTFHASRLANGAFRLWNQVFRYFEVMLLASVASIFLTLLIFTAFGMIASDGRANSVATSTVLPPACILVCLLPGILLYRWYVRWPSFIIGTFAAFWVFAR